MRKKRRGKPGPEVPAPVQRTPWPERLSWQIVALLLLVLVAYANSLDGGFHFDDQTLFSYYYITAPGFGWEILRLEQTRPLIFLTFHWNYLAGGTNPEGYHWVSLLLHAANSILVLLIARRQLPALARYLSGGLAAWLAAAIFALHPLQTQAVDYVFQRATVLATFFALLCFLFFLKERYAWSVFAFALSLLAKEETIALPAFLILYDLVRKKSPLPKGYYAALLGVAALVSARLFYVLHTMPEPQVGFRTYAVSPLSYALTQTRVIWIYLRLFLFPVGLNLDHDVRFSQGLLSPPATLVALLALLALVGALVWLSFRGEQPALWALGFFLLLAPSSSVVPVADVIFEHRTYFPLICLVMAAAWLLWKIPARFRTVAVSVLVVAMLIGTIARNRVWHDERSLWTDVLAKSPHKARAYTNLAMSYYADDLPRCRQLLEQGLQFDPDDSDARNHLGIVLMAQKDWKDALEQFRQAMALSHETAQFWSNIGVAQASLGELNPAVESLRRALALDPCEYAARRNLMLGLARLGNKEEALRVGQFPAKCSPTPDQVRELEEARRSLP